MGEQWEPNSNEYKGQPNPNANPNPNSNEYRDQPNPNGYKGQPDLDEIDKKIEELGRKLVQGASEAQVRLKRVVDKANDYWVQAQQNPTPRQASNVEEQRLRQLVNDWSNTNWRVARDLGNYMDIVSWHSDEVWEISLETRLETRTMEVISEPYTGNSVSRPRPLLPVWDYQLPDVTGLKAPQTRTRLEGMDEIVSCTSCNSTGHILCSGCNGRGWIVCPDCKGRTKKRCDTCRGRGYVADWTPKEKKSFFKKQAENITNSFGSKVSDVFDNIRQQGVPIPNPVDTDPAGKGPTLPCPDCINGEMPCTCGNGKRVCNTCQGSRMSLCPNCSGTGKVVRHREIVRRFDLRSQARFVGSSPVPENLLTASSGDLLYSAEVNEPLQLEVLPDMVPFDVWGTTVEIVNAERKVPEKAGVDSQTFSRPTLQVVELVRIPFTTVQYRFNDQDYLLHIYDIEGNEKIYADRFPARWDRIERLVKAISNDLTVPNPSAPDAPQTTNNAPTRSYGGGYRVPIEVPPYTISEDDDDLPPYKPNNGNNNINNTERNF